MFGVLQVRQVVADQVLVSSARDGATELTGARPLQGLPDRRRVGHIVRWPLRLDRFGETKVEHLHGAASRQRDVGRLQIPMNDPFLVSRLERLDNLQRDGLRFIVRQ